MSPARARDTTKKAGRSQAIEAMTRLRRHRTRRDAIPLGETQRLPQLLGIKPHHRLAVDQGHRRCPKPQLHKLLQGGLIRPDVLDDERHTVLRKELFLPVAGPSPRLRIHHHLVRHGVLRSWIDGPAEARLRHPYRQPQRHYTRLPGLGQRMRESDAGMRGVRRRAPRPPSLIRIEPRLPQERS